jgi:hypothetical protein
MIWIWLHSAHVIRPIIGFLLFSALPHTAQIVEIVLSAGHCPLPTAALPLFHLTFPYSRLIFDCV